MLKIESGTEFLISIKGHNSGLNRRNLPIYNPKPLLPNINSYTKFEENRSQNAQDRERKQIFNVNQGSFTLDLIDEICPSTIPNHSFLISTIIQSLKKISQKMLKIESGTEFLISIKGHNSGLNRRNLPIYNPKPLLPNINSYTKFEENQSQNTQDRERKQIFNVNQGSFTLDLIDEICPSTIPNHSFLISTIIQSLKKISQKNAKDRDRNRIFNINQGPLLWT